MENNISGLALLRAPFPANAISKLPKPYKKDSPKGKCAECGGYHGLPAVHLDYVGHAALTDRLLDADPCWSWEPVSFDEKGFPAMDRDGGLWIKLTVCGVTRLGYGSADGKTGCDAMKERIGDALRNAAMRFGAALDLWHKGELHGDDWTPPPVVTDQPKLPASAVVSESGQLPPFLKPKQEQTGPSDADRAAMERVNAAPVQTAKPAKVRSEAEKTLLADFSAKLKKCCIDGESASKAFSRVLKVECADWRKLPVRTIAVTMDGKGWEDFSQAVAAIAAEQEVSHE